jgi:3-methyl-2-oxobutanoate hydroxymethyltransferase
MRITIRDVQAMKSRGERISMFTAYDYTTAKLLDRAGVPMLLVGDSLGMTVLGYDSTIPVTLDDMVHHVKAVMRGAHRPLVVGDMPFMTFQVSESQTVANAGRLLQVGGCQAVKLEGGVRVASTVTRLVEAGIPVMGHIGLTPQSVNELGGYRAQGKTAEAATRLLLDAQALEEAGVFAVVLECIPTPLARVITDRLKVPTIGIGAGPHCDGQVQVINDLLGLNPDFTPRHAKPYAQMGLSVIDIARQHMEAVQDGSFPEEQNGYQMDEAALVEFLQRT